MMNMVKRMEPLLMLMVIVGAVNYAIIALLDTNVLSEIFGSGTALDVVYVVVGVAGLTFVPKLMDALHIGGHYGRPHGA